MAKEAHTGMMKLYIETFEDCPKVWDYFYSRLGLCPDSIHDKSISFDRIVIFEGPFRAVIDIHNIYEFLGALMQKKAFSETDIADKFYTPIKTKDLLYRFIDCVEKMITIIKLCEPHLKQEVVNA
jgi:hypothetical protein